MTEPPTLQETMEQVLSDKRLREMLSELLANGYNDDSFEELRRFCLAITESHGQMHKDCCVMREILRKCVELHAREQEALQMPTTNEWIIFVDETLEALSQVSDYPSPE